MTFFTVILLFITLLSDPARDGNKAYEEGNFAQAEVLYREAMRDNPEDPRLIFNLANSLAKQQKFEEALAAFEQYKAIVENPAEKSKADYSIGNILGGLQQWDKALNYYKEALKRDPADDEAKYNYELAYKQKQQQKEDQKQNGDQNNENKDDKDQKNDQNENKEQQQEQDKQQQDQQQQDDQQNKDDQEKQQQQQEQQQEQNGEDKPEDQKQQQQPKEGQMTKEQAEKILQALDKKESDLLKQFKKPKNNNKKKNNEKDW